MSARLALSLPGLRDRLGRNHPYLIPRDDAARHEIERQIIDVLGIGGVES